MSSIYRLFSLPKELQKVIVGWLDPKSGSRFAMTCKKGYEIVYNGKLWQMLQLGNFVQNDRLCTVQHIFNLKPTVDQVTNPDDATKKHLLRVVRILLQDASVSYDEWKKVMEAAKTWHKKIEEMLLQNESYTLQYCLERIEKLKNWGK